MELEGTGVTPKKGAGKVYFYEKEDFSLSEKSDKTVEEEKERFDSAVREAEEQLEKEAESTEEKTEGNEADIFEAQIQFLEDPQIESNVKENIEEGLTAEKAVKKGFEQPIEQMESQEGRMAERADDLRDIRDRLLRILTGREKEGLSGIPENAVVVADNLKPSDTSELEESRVGGIVTAKGSETSHVAILSKSMGIPAVVGVENIEDLKDAEKALVDGVEGKVVADPAEEKIENISESQEIEVIEERVQTEDGKEVGVAANVANPEEVSKAVENGADGIGLYRTEFMFLEREEPPTEEEHLQNYREALEAFPDERVIIRTMDIGGDKSVPYLELEGDNPFLGMRGIRLAFDRGEELFETQMKALLRAAAAENGENLAVMFPMISNVSEFDKVLKKVEKLEDELEEKEKDFDRPEIGLMVETPSAVQMAGELAEKADFLSIGTNDLTQYTMAASRTDSEVSDLQKPTYPSVLRSIKETVKKGHENDAWVGMCGEMAGNTDLAELLVGIGLDELSMSSPLVPHLKEKATGLDASEAEETAVKVLEASTREGVLEVLRK